MGEDEIKLSELTNTNLTNDEDILMIVQNGSNKKISIGALFQNAFEKIYHVGKIVIETSNTNPSTYLGFGTWVLWGQGRVPVGVDLDDQDFNEVEKIGGEKTHTHKYGLQYGEYYSDLSIKSNPNAGLLNYTNDKDYSLSNNSNNLGNHSVPINSGNQEGAKSQSMGHYRLIANTSYVESMGPYITCYMWKRVA